MYVSVACACWAYAFVVPIFLHGYSPTQIAIARYFFYGMLSVVLFFTASGRKRFPLKYWLMAFFLGLTGNVLYYYLLVIGINLTGPEIAIPIGGMMPVAVAILGNWLLKEFPLSKIAMPLTVSFVGLLFVNFTYLPAGEGVSGGAVFGILASCASLMLWSWYGVTNAAFLKRNSDINSSTWTNMIGIMSLVQVLMWGGVDYFYFGYTQIPSIATKDFLSFCLWTASLGIVSSWLGTMAWNIGAKKLPITLAGQFIVMEPLLGLVYVFLYKGKLPTILEMAGFAVCILGIVLTLRKIQGLRLQAA
ncbi:DMT family transporter [Comamonas nitrativorans]|uniref:DMT family transporter n=1 Tax=Comamonas nitrativorans TaxID=108437 RepID=A0ABV9GWV5_9BURK